MCALDCCKLRTVQHVVDKLQNFQLVVDKGPQRLLEFAKRKEVKPWLLAALIASILANSYKLTFFIKK